MPRLSVLLLNVALFVGVSGAVPDPAPFGVVPSERQLAWHRLEAYAFIHFTVNTFTDREWGYGDESPALFAPTAFDADQIVGTVKAAGLAGLILTAKHHDGFALWPSRHTEHSIRHSPFRDGRGDVVREIADACRRAGIAFGVYLSPWDRNRADYGQPSYIKYYRNQLRELLTGYGPIFEVWFDGANGGDGFYGGAREQRRIDNATYYDWPETWRLVRTLQPEAVIFSDGGPDVRWVGNEKGEAGDPCWATINATGFYPGRGERLGAGDRHGTHWIPAEADVSIRPGWFYHASEDAAVKTPAELFAIYLNSVGRGASLILNLTPDRRGLIPAPDVAAVTTWGRLVRETFARDLAAGATVRASNVRGGDPRFAADRTLDGRRETYWATDDTVRQAELVLEFDESRTFDLVRLREHLPLGQRIDRVAVDVYNEETQAWRVIAEATAVGSQRLLPVAAVTTRRVRLRVLESAAAPALAEFGLYMRPTP